MKTFIKNGSIVTKNRILQGCIVIEDGKILEVGYMGDITQNAKVIDAEGAFIMPGFVEVHVHGGGGFDYMDGTVEAFNAVSKVHRDHGTTTILPTTVACSFDSMVKVFDTYRKVL